MQLQDMQVDYIQEMFNTGLGDAAVELSELVNDEVLISVPKFALLSRDQLIEQLGSGLTYTVGKPKKFMSCMLSSNISANYGFTK